MCEDFLLLPTAQLSIVPEDPAYVWRWLVRADQLNMPTVVRKCITFIQVGAGACLCGASRAAFKVPAGEDYRPMTFTCARLQPQRVQQNGRRVRRMGVMRMSHDS